MEVKETGIEGLLEIYPRVFEDSRGFFFEAFKHEFFQNLGYNFVQDNQSFSKKGVLRGLHLQLPPNEQAKLVRTLTGKVLDVVVDLRKSSATFGKVYTCLLDSSKSNMLLVPEGFGHGFVALEDSLFFYKCSNYYNKASESGIIWNDKDLSIDWQLDDFIISEKDEELPTFQEFVDKNL
ncbi:MAG: dTDP-4-dehydrorhamnose 3,5-epimerase [Bacteroidota bacterium]